MPTGPRLQKETSLEGSDQNISEELYYPAIIPTGAFHKAKMPPSWVGRMKPQSQVGTQ